MAEVLIIGLKSEFGIEKKFENLFPQFPISFFLFSLS